MSGGRQETARSMLGNIANNQSNLSGKSDMERLNDAATKITQNAAIRNAQAEAAEADRAAQEYAEALAAANERHVEIEPDANEADEDFDDEDDDPLMESIKARRIEQLKAQQAAERINAAQGHGEYREIVEEEFLKEVCGSVNVVVHFYHPEFFRCKIMDKHLRILANKHRGTKFIYLNAEKAPFFTQKLHITILPALFCFRDGIKGDMLFGFEQLGAKDDFRTEVLEHWLGLAGAIKMKAKSAMRAQRAFDTREESAGESDDDGDESS